MFSILASVLNAFFFIFGCNQALSVTDLTLIVSQVRRRFCYFVFICEDLVVSVL